MVVIAHSHSHEQCVVDFSVSSGDVEDIASLLLFQLKVLVNMNAYECFTTCLKQCRINQSISEDTIKHKSLIQ